jgi:trk system potassium uptake protein TrkA
MKILIFGCTRLTDALAPVLLQDGHQVTVLDPDADRLALLQRDTAVTAVRTAEPLMQDYLQEGGISDSWGFLALSEDDHKNVLVCQIASHIFNIPKVLCRLSDPQLQEFYQSLGLEIVDAGPDFIQNTRQAINQQAMGQQSGDRQSIEG